jgi:cytochrome P450
MSRCRELYGDLFTLDLLPRAVAGPGANRGEGHWVFLSDPEHVKQVFTADPEAVRTGETNMFLQPLVGSRSILVLDEPDHMTQRKLMLPPLHGDRVGSYGERMSEAARAEVERWPTGEPFALWPRMQAITLEVIVRTVFGISEPSRLAQLQDLLRTLLNQMTSARWLAGQVLLTALRGPERAQRSRSVRALLDPVDAAVLEEVRLRRLAADLHERDDILSMLMQASYEDGSPMSDGELRDELMTLLIAGHESTATALAWAFERLLRHPGKLARLRVEAEAGQDEYADAVVKETLRLRPVLPIVLRKLTEPIEIGGYLLPAQTWVAPCAYLIHRREDLYPNPCRFRPERFIERPAGTYTWMPFGGGVRRCLGASFAQLEMKRVLQTVVTQAELRPARAESEHIRPRFITLAPSRGAQVVMTGRRGPASPERVEPGAIADHVPAGLMPTIP